MKDSDYTFGNTLVQCDGVNCNAEETIEGFDGHPYPYATVNEKTADEGWTCTKRQGEFIDLCPDCTEKENKF